MTLRHHSPPAVTVQVGPGWLLGAALLVLACVGLAAVAYVGWASSGRVALGLLAVWALGVWGPERPGAICRVAVCAGTGRHGRGRRMPMVIALVLLQKKNV